MAPILNEATLPDFKPKKDVVAAANRSMTAIEWAFSSCWPPSERGIFVGADGFSPNLSNESMRMHATPAMQWSYTLMHLGHHYERGLRKFIITTEDRTLSMLVEVTSLKACPENIEGLNVLPQSDFRDLISGESLGALPLLFVRYLYGSIDRNPSMEAAKFINHANKTDGG